MCIANLEMSTARAASALGVCETAVSRKIAAAEHFLVRVVLAEPRRLATSGRPDRVIAAAVSRLTTIAAVIAADPSAASNWIASLIDRGVTRERNEGEAQRGRRH